MHNCDSLATLRDTHAPLNGIIVFSSLTSFSRELANYIYSVNAWDKNGLAQIHHIVKSESQASDYRAHLLTKLIDGNSSNLNIDRLTQDGETAFGIATRNQNFLLMGILLAAGADPKRFGLGQQSPVELLKTLIKENAQEEHSEAFLFLSAIEGLEKRQDLKTNEERADFLDGILRKKRAANKASNPISISGSSSNSNQEDSDDEVESLAMSLGTIGQKFMKFSMPNCVQEHLSKSPDSSLNTKLGTSPTYVN